MKYVLKIVVHSAIYCVGLAGPKVRRFSKKETPLKPGTAVPERRTSMKIWTDDECIEVDPNDVGELEAAMLFKAEHIKAKADPELFAAVADMLSILWDSATKRVDVVRCRECNHCDPENYHCDHPMSTAAPLRRKPDDFCSYGNRKEDS